jgi:uncharacterized protein (DUF2336 family)
MDDVHKLAQDPSAAARVGTAAKLAQQFNAAAFGPSEIKLAQEIFRVMARDAEVRVREALAANLKSNPNLSRDIAVILARDVDSVSVPMLSFSEVLTADDLVEIVNAQSSFAKMEAIAGRKAVDESVSAALVERGSERVVARLVSNPGAQVSEPSLHRVVDRFGDSEAVQVPLVHRAALPVTVTERLVTHVADHLRSYLLSKHEISADVAMDLVLQSRERATVGLAIGVADDALAALVRQLAAGGRLTASLVLRAICMGNLRFFEHALAALAGIPLGNVRALVHETSGAGLRALWTKGGLPDGMLPAIRAAVAVIDETELDAGANAPDRYARRILERVLTQCESFGAEFAGDDLEYLLARVAQLPPSHGTGLH